MNELSTTTSTPAPPRPTHRYCHQHVPSSFSLVEAWQGGLTWQRKVWNCTTEPELFQHSMETTITGSIKVLALVKGRRGLEMIWVFKIVLLWQLRRSGEMKTLKTKCKVSLSCVNVTWGAKMISLGWFLHSMTVEMISLGLFLYSMTVSLTIC